MDPLQIEISKARERLSKESLEAIDSINWKQIISGMNIKFNSEQIEDLKTEVELLLCGLTATENFPLELENRLKISKNEVVILINELDKLIFKKIQKELENILKGVTPRANKPLVFDPRFANVPKKTQEAIAMSDWQNNLHEIAKKYKLSIDKLDPLEKLTVQIITGDIEANKYRYEIGQQFSLSVSDSNNLVIDVDNNILKEIKENLKIDLHKNEDIVPLPPYSRIIKNEELRIKNEKLEMRNEGDENKTGDVGGIVFEPIKNDTSVVTPLAINMLKDKMVNTTTSTSSVSDYSLPKINIKTEQPAATPVAFNSNLHDPYHEEI